MFLRCLSVQVVRLHERSSAHLAELDELRAAKSSCSLLALTAGGADAAGAASTAAGARSAAADKELMLRQIDSLKEVRWPCGASACAGV